MVRPCQGRKKVTQFINEGICRKGPAKPGLLKNCMINLKGQAIQRPQSKSNRGNTKKAINVNSIVCDLYIMKIYSCTLF